MAKPLRFDGKVVVVTGAGNGLGRTYALAFAERGASVVVNDLGGSSSGVGKSSKAADQVVFEIKTKGGKAVANYDSVEDGEKIVQTALDTYGKIDIVVNNAGILRDRSFARISNDDWDIIHRVHLRGSFLVTRAAWPHMKKQGFGRIILVSSGAGIYGNFGQANYSAAKLGLVGLANTLAIEGEKYDIHCNCVAPMAGSRMTETVMPKEVLQALKPEYVAPLVVYLCHDSCTDNGGLYEVGAGWVGKLRWQRSDGAVIREKNTPVTPEAVRDNWDKISDFTKSSYPALKDSSAFIIQIANKLDQEESEAQKGTAPQDPVEYAKSFETEPVAFSYNERDAIIYALGVGVSTKQEDYLKFLFELSGDFTVLPTYGVIPAFACFMNSSMGDALKGLNIDVTRVLHGEQYLELYKPLPRSGKLTSTLKVVDILDKKSGAVILYNVETFDENNEKVAFNQFATFAVGAGNFGGPKSSNEAKPLIDAPGRDPDAFMEEKTGVDQAALYRLSGDRNPLHIDPSFAAMGGFQSPILHGLCSFGYAVRHVMAKFADNDMSRFKAVKVRFAKPVLPGQTLRTDMWKSGNRVFFRTKVVENGNICISGAYVDLTGSTTSESMPKSPVSELKSSAIFHQMASQVKSSGADLASKVKAVFQWIITKDGKQASSWTVDLKNVKSGDVYEGAPRTGKADCTLTVSDDDFLDIVMGKLDAQKAFMGGKLKLSGNMMLATKLGDILKMSSKL